MKTALKTIAFASILSLGVMNTTWAADTWQAKDDLPSGLGQKTSTNCGAIAQVEGPKAQTDSSDAAKKPEAPTSTDKGSGN